MSSLFLALVLVAHAGPEGDATSDDPKEDEGPKWDVAAPPGEARSVPIDTRTGTWMTVDVSPDGQQLVFDLLGDLYLLPIAGGEARSISSGLPWDMQPRFSPDGTRVAFTSDRGGGDNIWTVARDGSDPVQVTKEKFRLLNSPAWSPDGAWIVARKHFTKDRSLGAGEMWLYRADGSGGARITEKKSEQKDTGEPVFSPDGRFLYVSRDATGGDRFEYNKDPNKPIYAIERVDLERGDTIRVTGGPGGAVRPTPSPDGRSLAFVRRIRAHSVLMVRDLATGAERALWDGLDRDMQETWAIHGVYAAFDWLPDGSGLVIWAGGGLHRVALDGTVADIPFHVQDSREVRDAIRLPVQVAPERFQVRALREVAVSPGGSQVVFEALGRLWIREVKGGVARRLTRQEDHVELQPAWSRDGKRIVYATWDDELGGSVAVVAARGGRGKPVVTAPGHYVEPAWSPSGDTIAYRKLSGGWLRTPMWSEEPGIYVVPTRGGTPERVLRSGWSPHFGASDDRLYYVDQGEEDQLALHSLGLHERDDRVHATLADGVDLRVSPDGAHVGFQVSYNAYVAPMPALSRPLVLDPEGKAVPVGRASRDVGDDLQFAAGKLWWRSGPVLGSASLDALFARKDGKPTWKPDEAPLTDLGWDERSDHHDATMAIVGARVVTMRGDEVIEDGAVLWRGSRIVAVGPRGEVAIPLGARVFDGAGKTVIPGLIDVHAHHGQGRDGIPPESNWADLSLLSFGVTTIHDPSNDTASVFYASEEQRAGRLVAPRIFSTGTILYGAHSPGATAKIDSLDDALSHLRRLQAVGAFSVKSYNQPRRDQRQQVLEAGRQLGMMVVPEGGSLLMMNLTQVVDGHTGVEHALPVARVYDDVLQLWGATQVGYTPTLGVAYGGLMGENYWYAHTHVWDDARLAAFVPREVIDAASRRSTLVPDEEYNHIDVARAAKALSDAGVRVNLGAHGQREGLAAHWELWMLVQGGMTPLEALRAGTLNGAWYVGLDGDLGSLEPGKLADMAVIDGNPLADIRVSEKVALTVLGGRVYDAATMDQLAPAVVKQPPVYFHRPGHGGPTKTDTATCGCGAP